ncbi:MAG: S9 family peptidase [Bacteroidota bacterium]|nr:S9 family peptidase [Bacteroidota bacterium]
MKQFLLLAYFLFNILSLPAQNKSTITHEDMWSFKRVGAPAISPDGNWVIFSVLETTYDEKEQVNDVWVVSTGGATTPRKLTSGKAGESGYTWSPDGKYIAFVAKRDGEDESQIYLLNFKDGGEAQRFTNLSTGASSPNFSPDGSMILFTSNVFPKIYIDSVNKKLIEEKKKIKYKARVYSSFPIRDWDKWIDEKQSHAFVQSMEPESIAKDIFSEVAISKLEGFKFFNATWTNDSKEIVFSATVDAHTAAYQEPSTQLYKLSLSGGDATKLTTDKNDYASVQFTKDGKYLFAYSSANNNNKVYNLNKLVRFDWPGMQNRLVVSEKLDRPINNFIIHGDQLYLNVEDEGNNKIYKLSIHGGDHNLFSLTKKGCFANLNSSTTNDIHLVATYETSSMPPEIIKLNSDGSHTFLTKINAKKLSALDLPDAEIVWFTSSRNKNIRSLIMKPSAFDSTKKYPLVVLMHGGPAGSIKDDWSYRWNNHLLAKSAYVILWTDFTGSTGYGEKFSQDIQFDPFKGPAQEILEAAADATKRFSFIDPARQAAGGASYGGHLANWMQAINTHFKCLISHAGLINSLSQWGTSDVIYGREVMNGSAPWKENKTWKEQNPYRYAEKFKTPMLITVGENDFRVPLNNSLENWNTLQRQKVPSKLIVFPDENHWILKGENSRFFYSEVHAWLEKYLK